MPVVDVDLLSFVHHLPPSFDIFDYHVNLLLFYLVISWYTLIGFASYRAATKCIPRSRTVRNGLAAALRIIDRHILAFLQIGAATNNAWVVTGTVSIRSATTKKPRKNSTAADPAHTEARFESMAAARQQIVLHQRLLPL